MVHEQGDDEHRFVVPEVGEDSDETGGCDVLEEDEEQNGMEDIVEVGQQFSPDHPFLVGLKQYLTSRHRKRGRQIRSVLQCHGISHLRVQNWTLRMFTTSISWTATWRCRA